MRPLIAPILALVVGLTSVAGAQDFEEGSKKRSKPSGSSRAPTGFLVTEDDDGASVADEAPPQPKKQKKVRRDFDDDEPPAPKRAVTEEEDLGPSGTRAWTDAPRGRGIQVIQENTAAPSTIRMGEEDPDRVGRPLGAGSGGVRLAPSRQGDDGSYTFKANDAVEGRSTKRKKPVIQDDDEEEAAPVRRGRVAEEEEEEAPQRPSKQTVPSRASRAPIGLIASPDEDFAETPRARRPDPFGAEEPRSAPPPVQQAPVRLSRPDPSALSREDDGPTVGGGGWVAPRNSIPDAGEASSMKVEEVDVRSNIDGAFVDDSGRNRKQPSPPAKAVKARIVAEEPPAPSRRLLPSPVRAPEPEPEAVVEPKADDPFTKLESDLAKIEGRAPVAPDQGLPKGPELKVPDPDEEESRPARPPPVPKENFTDPEFAVKPLEIKDDPAATRNEDGVGITALAAVGVALARDPQSGTIPDLAFGAAVEWSPEFLGSLSLDASWMLATRSDGTNFVGVDTQWHHIAVRVLYVRPVSQSLYLAVAAGPLMTMTRSNYRVKDGAEAENSASATRFGVDASAIIGMQFGALAVRLDLRTLLRGGLRLDFLPQLGVGVAF